jgi:DNA-binding NarL/FixJ family response regulator
MGAGVATIVVEQRLIVRAALASLLETPKYRVVCSVANAKNVTRASIAGEECKLAILGALSADDGANEAVHVRKLWPECKILLLLDAASCSDLQRLVASEIDGCIPLDASADTLSKALELIMVQKLRVMVAGGSKLRLMPDAQQDASQRLLSVIKDEALSIVIADIPKIAAKENGRCHRNDDSPVQALVRLRTAHTSMERGLLNDLLPRVVVEPELIERRCCVTLNENSTPRHLEPGGRLQLLPTGKRLRS